MCAPQVQLETSVRRTASITTSGAGACAPSPVAADHHVAASAARASSPVVARCTRPAASYATIARFGSPAQLVERVAFPPVRLPAVLGQLDSAEGLREGGERA